ncbi:MAG: hypothetical protein M1281_19465 [Chloroflexi bacterium]|nr:hypothetical protein [Chloroflexota bacterium]
MAEATAPSTSGRLPRISKRLRLVTAGRLSSRSGWVTLAGVLLMLGIWLVDKGPTLAANAAPSGADPGNWLSLAWGITGQSARLAPWAYPPLTFVALRIFLAFMAPLTALKVLGVLTWIGMGAAFWIVMQRFIRRLPIYVRFALAILFAFSGYEAEIFAWGGYPQLAGMAFLILAIPYTEKWLEDGERRDGLAAAVFIGAVIFTHHLLTAMLPVLWVVLFMWSWLQKKDSRKMVLRRFLVLSVAIFGISLAALPIYWKYISLLAGNPANSSGFGFQTLPLLISYLFRQAAWLWIALTFVAIIAPFWLRRHPLSGSVLAFTWGSLFCFAVLWEVRLLQGLFAGIVLGLALVLDEAWGKRLAPGLQEIVRGSSTVLLGGVLLVLIPAGQQQFLQASAYYRVASNDMLPGITWLKDHSQPGDRVASSKTNPDLLGWWIEGLAGRPTFYATDLRWLSFTQERSNAEIANTIFNPSTPPRKAEALIGAYHIRWIFVDENTSKNSLPALVQAGVLSIAYQDNRVTIFKVNKLPAASLTGGH